MSELLNLHSYPWSSDTPQWSILEVAALFMLMGAVCDEDFTAAPVEGKS